MPIIYRTCSRCKSKKPEALFTYLKGGEHWRFCTSCYRSFSPPNIAGDDCDKILDRVARSCGERGIEFRLEREHILPLPNKCCYLGITLLYKMPHEKTKRWDDAVASLDRIDNNKGYIPGNVQVISYLANRMKQTASIEQLIQFGVGVLKTHRPELLAD